MRISLPLRFLVLAWLLSGLSFAQAHDVGFRELTVDSGSERPLSVGLWYPSAENAPQSLLGDNSVFVGELVQRGAAALPGKYPLLILSHGFGGNWRNQNWLAYALVRQGFVVVAPNHPGSTSGQRPTAQFSTLWKRPQDLSRVLDALLNEPALVAVIDIERMAAIGHSLGGWTVMLAGGARFDPAQLENDCLTHAQLAACKIYRLLLAGEDAESRSENQARLASAQRDERIKAVVSLDLGLARGLTAASLRAMPVPVLVIAAGTPNPELPAELESQAMLTQLPAKTPYLEILEATHFSFLQACKPGAELILRDAAPEDQDICQAGGLRSRLEIHTQVAEAIVDFLQVALNLKSSQQ